MNNTENVSPIANFTPFAALNLDFSHVVGIGIGNHSNLSASRSGNAQSVLPMVVRALIMLAGLVGNTLVVVTLLRHRGMRTVTNLLLLNLSMSDLLIISVCMSFTLVVEILQNFVFGTLGCIIIRFCQGVTIAANAFTLCAIALERYFAIVLPFKSRGFQTVRHAQKMIGCIWLMAVLLMIPFGSFHSARPLNGNSTTERCEVHAKDKVEWRIYFFFLVIVLIVIPAIFLATAYGLILIALSKRLRFHNESERKQASSLCQSANANQNQNQKPIATTNSTSTINSLSNSNCHYAKDRNASTNGTKPSLVKKTNGAVTMKSVPRGDLSAKSSISPQRSQRDNSDYITNRIVQSTNKTITMLLLIVALFFICCVPNYAQQTWYMLDPEQAKRFLRAYSGYILLLQHLNTCVNPLCYCFMSKSFRRHFLRVFGCRTWKDGSIPHSIASNTVARKHTIDSLRKKRCGRSDAKQNNFTAKISDRSIPMTNDSEIDP